MIRIRTNLAPTHQQHPQLTELMNSQRHITVFPAQLVRQIKQQRADRGKGLIAIGNQTFTAGISSHTEQRTRRRGGFGGGGIEIVIQGTLRGLVEFQIGRSRRIRRYLEHISSFPEQGPHHVATKRNGVAAVRRLVDRGNYKSRRVRRRPAHSHHQAQTRRSDRCCLCTCS